MANTGLPPGWNAHQAGDGRWYYAHQSGMTQWHHPGAGGAPVAHGHAPVAHGHAPVAHGHAPAVQGGMAGPSHGATGGGKPMMSQLAARYVSQHPIEFKLKEKAFSLSGDSFSIKRLDTGEGTFQVKGKAISIKDSKKLLDASGNPIYKMTEELLTLRGRMSIVDVQTKAPVVTLRKKGYFRFFGAGTIQAWAGASDDGEPYLEVKGEFFKRNFTIVEKATGRTLASISRKPFTVTNFLLEKDTYVIRVEPNVDTALMVFFVVAADEMYRDDGNRKGLF